MAQPEDGGSGGRSLRNLFLPVVIRFFVADESICWMYDYRVSDELGAPAGAST